MKLPQSLNRRAIRQSFTKVSEAKWDSFFHFEKQNGLFELRVQGPDKHAYYGTDDLMRWLVQRGLYRRLDFYGYGEILYIPEMPVVRRHVMAG